MHRFRWLVSVLLVGTLEAAEPVPPKVDEPAVALARSIAAAASESERARLLAAAPAELQVAERLYKALQPIEFQAGLEGDLVKCEALAHFSLALGRQQNDPAVMALARSRLANALRQLGQPREALVLQHEVVKFWEAKGDPGQIASELAGRGITELALADFQSAQRSLQRAIFLASQPPHKHILISSLNSLGNVYRQQGRPERALASYEQARALVGDDQAWNMAFIFNNLGQSHEQMGEPERAAEFVQQALAVAERVKFRPRVANANTFLGEIRLAQGRVREAGEHFERARQLSVELRDPPSEARALLGLARCGLRAGSATTALAFAEGAVELYDRLGKRDFLAPALTVQGRCLRALQRDGEARVAFETAIVQVENVRGQLAGSEADAQSFLERQVAPYQELVGLLVDAGEVADALLRAEQAKARVLLDLVRHGRRDWEADLNAEERASLAASQRRLSQAARTLRIEEKREPSDAAALAAAQGNVRSTRQEDEELRDRLRQAHPGDHRQADGVVGRFNAQSLEMVRERAAVWLEFVVTEERTYLFSRHGDAAPTAHVIAIPRRELAQRVEQFRRRIAGRDLHWRQDARPLFDLLLGPVAASLQGASEVLIVPDGALWELPFAALVDASDRCLLESVALQFSPSLEWLIGEPARVLVSPAPAKKPLPEGVLLAGNPSLGEDSALPALPEAGRQLREIARVYAGRDVTLLTGTAATTRACLAALPAQRTIHFATHGILNNVEPLASHLVLAQTDSAGGESGLLEARQVMGQTMNASLVVLAACETGRGRVGAGEGMIGLSWAFAVAGCDATVVSQWKVESASTSDLLIGFHRRLREPGAHFDGPKALREAALAVAHAPDSSHPFYWAPFIFIGRK